MATEPRLQLVGWAQFVPYPERFRDVMATIGRDLDEADPLVYWEHEGSSIISPLDYPSEGVYFTLDHSMPRDIGRGAWRVIDFNHPRCVFGCGRFIRKSRDRHHRQRFVCWSCDPREDY